MRRRDREDCIKTLIESGQIEAVQENTSGRPSTRFRAVANSSSS
jgi:predicted ArsR family transcriptional regulator